MNIGSTTSATSTASATGINGFSELSSEEFIKVLFTELQNQDPFQPQDSGALLEQLSSLRNIESQMSLQNQLKDLVLQNQIASGGNLIGKMVQGLDENNDKIAGLVQSIRVAEDKVMLELDTGRTLEMSRVSAIAEPAAAEQA